MEEQAWSKLKILEYNKKFAELMFPDIDLEVKEGEIILERLMAAKIACILGDYHLLCYHCSFDWQIDVFQLLSKKVRELTRLRNPEEYEQLNIIRPESAVVVKMSSLRNYYTGQFEFYSPEECFKTLCELLDLYNIHNKKLK